MEPRIKVKAITKYIDKMYKPTNIEISGYDTEEVVIDVFFDKIDDKYDTNPFFSDKKRLKERNFALEIRNYIYKFFRIKTSGLSLEGFLPYVSHGISIFVHLI
jgi:hypothetical protein